MIEKSGKNGYKIFTFTNNKKNKKLEVNSLRLFSAISRWHAKNYEKKLSEMRSQDLCPECHGRGFSPWMISEYSYHEDFSCHACYGTGLFSNWAETTQHTDLI
jgi:DnaJ-class molecular chaperone